MIKKLTEILQTKINVPKIVWDILETLMYCLIAILVAQLVIHFVVQRTVVDGESMCTTLDDGDNILIEKLSYTFGDVERFDVVVFPYNDPIRGKEVYYIKRIIGMPGETLLIENGVIYLLDEEAGTREVLEENYGYYLDGEPMEGFRASEPVHIPEGCYFVLGDNRNNSRDSRQIGLIQGKDILGKAWLKIYPFNEMKFID